MGPVCLVPGEQFAVCLAVAVAEVATLCLKYWIPLNLWDLPARGQISRAGQDADRWEAPNGSC